ncbi:MarR family winged helix-turn-helix transcriptional regulator [Janibacter hoylei]|uniref:MarR family transcriptional regulator n=1 Tax=Janibacter hoylei PVAS-1 TaxID=1210046 RepID=K1E1K4_9MICO|nr:MarR family transcriptional regulator [Janibacter hoylei]EKA62579.1 MarR family transcriptional regulator [Janibacter hoylei PVAS-1]RWU84676.1 MarR family transcriptional regulator [Janibacter hoylei PVAS-1]
MEPRWLDDDEMRTWLQVVALAEVLPSRLDTQVRQDSGLTHFEYQVLAMLSEAPERTLRMSWLARRTNATLPRLSHVVRRLEERGLVARERSGTDARATDAVLTDAGWEQIVAAAPAHVTYVRERILDRLSRDQVQALGEIAGTLLESLDPSGDLTMRAADAPR